MKTFALLDACNTFYKVARKQEDLSILKANIGNYIHFSNSDRFGISYHKDVHPGNPRAIYGFPLTDKKYQKIVNNVIDDFYEYGYSKYIYVFSVSGNILNIDSVNAQELSDNLKEILQSKYSKSLRSKYNIIYPFDVSNGTQFLRLVGRVAKDLFKNEHSGINVLLRDLGYDAIETSKYGFGDDIESEIAVLNPLAVNVIAKINNPMLNKEQLKEIEWYQSPEYAEEQRKKELIREEKRKKTDQELARKKQFLDEEKETYNLVSKLNSDHKFDEATAVRNAFKEKWKDFY
jgi:hypothetical protein